MAAASVTRTSSRARFRSGVIFVDVMARNPTVRFPAPGRAGVPRRTPVRSSGGATG